MITNNTWRIWINDFLQLYDIYSGVVPNPEGVSQFLEMEIGYIDVRRNLALANLKSNPSVVFNSDG